MPRRRLSPEERALWRTLTRTVTPLRRARPRPETEAEAQPPPQPEALAELLEKPRIKGRVPPARPAPPLPAPAAPAPVPVLDGSWEKRIRGGRLSPDISVDLHGLTLAAAHLRLERLLGDAVRQGWRVLLVVTGRPRPAPAPGEARRRGAIRAEIGDWLARSAHAGRIASVRQAHPRHGGDGALYIILRRGE
ncbi:MAG: DNA mismatch repair protein MutS [Sphingobium sp. 66-54]|nr:MAG: DNA mismatch repair protein MutS [Sphingobium sp. 66-54]